MSNLNGVIADARKRMEAQAEQARVDRYGGFCQCGHGRFLHYIERPDDAHLACVCTCRGFVAAS